MQKQSVTQKDHSYHTPDFQTIIIPKRIWKFKFITYVLDQHYHMNHKMETSLI